MADKPKRAGRPTLHDYATAEVIRRATAAELAASVTPAPADPAG